MEVRNQERQRSASDEYAIKSRNKKVLTLSQAGFSDVFIWCISKVYWTLLHLLITGCDFKKNDITTILDCKYLFYSAQCFVPPSSSTWALAAGGLQELLLTCFRPFSRNNCKSQLYFVEFFEIRLFVLQRTVMKMQLLMPPPPRPRISSLFSSLSFPSVLCSPLLFPFVLFSSFPIFSFYSLFSSFFLIHFCSSLSPGPLARPLKSKKQKRGKINPRSRPSQSRNVCILNQSRDDFLGFYFSFLRLCHDFGMALA